MQSAADDLEYVVVATSLRTPVIIELVLRPVHRGLDFQPGQYVLLGDLHDERPVRSYSIANAPRPDGVVTLLVTRVRGGAVSTWAHDVLHPGDGVLLSGPYGSFVVDPDATGPLLLLAGGSGLAPARALAQDALHRPVALTTLCFSARTEHDLIDDELFRRWDREHPHFRYLRTLTRANGHLPDMRIPQRLGAWIPDLPAHRVYVAGGPGLVAACAEAARRAGVRPGNLVTEEFFLEPQPWGQPVTAAPEGPG